MLPSATSSSSCGARVIHAPRRWDRIERVVAEPQRVRRDGRHRERVAHRVGWLTGAGPRRGCRRTSGAGRSCRRPGRRRSPSRPGWSRRRPRGHDPDRDALAAAGVDVAGVAQRHLGVGGVQAADVLVGHPAAGADEDLPQRPLALVLAHAAPATAACAARVLSAYALAASRTQAPSSCARATVLHPRRVARPVALEHLEELRPVDLAERVVPGLLVQAQVGVGQRQPEHLGLRHRHVDELLPQVVVGEALDLPGHRLRGVGRLVVGRAEHHQRRPPPAVDRVLGHRVLRGRAVGERVQDLEALPLVEGLLLADAHHRAGVRPEGAAADRHLVDDRGAVDEPADRAHVGPGRGRVVEDRGVPLAAGVQQVEQLGAVDAQGLGGGVEVEPVAGLVLHLGHQDRLAAQAGRPADPVALGLHADDLGVRVLGDLADQRLAVRLGHPVPRLDPLVAVDERLEVRLTRVLGHAAESRAAM